MHYYRPDYLASFILARLVLLPIFGSANGSDPSLRPPPVSIKPTHVYVSSLSLPGVPLCTFLSPGAPFFAMRKLFAIFVNWSLLVSMCIFSVNALSCSSTLTAGRLNTCITREDGSVVCWGANEWGQLGRGFRGPSQFADVGEPLDFGSGVKVLTIALGTFHGCAILDDPNSAAS
eukprot:3107809-Rhodomonas_salina.1